MKPPIFSSEGKPLACVAFSTSPNSSLTAFWYSSAEMRRSGVGPTDFSMLASHFPITLGPIPGGGRVTPVAPPVPALPPELGLPAPALPPSDQPCPALPDTLVLPPPELPPVAAGPGPGAGAHAKGRRQTPDAKEN